MTRRSLASMPSIALAALLGLLPSLAGPAVQEVDRSKLPPEPEGFRLDGDVARGEAVFRKSCALCHGPGGKGDGRIQSDPPARDLTDAEALKTASDWELYEVIAEGGQILGLAAKMLPWKDILDEQELLDVATYVRSLAPPVGPRATSRPRDGGP